MGKLAFRYLAEFKSGDERKEAAENTLTSHKSAQVWQIYVCYFRCLFQYLMYFGCMRFGYDIGNGSLVIRPQGSPAFPTQNEVHFHGRPDIADMTFGQREMLL